MMDPRTAVKLLLVLVLGLPLVQAVLGWVGGLLTAMGDGSAETILGHVNTAAGIVWLLSVVGLLVMLAIRSLDEPHEPE